MMRVDKRAQLDVGELEAPVASLHPAIGGAEVDGGLRVRTEIRAGSLAAQGNIVQCYPAAPGGIFIDPGAAVGGR